MWGVDGDACSGAAEEGCLEGIGKREGGEWFEDWWVVGDDDGGWGGKSLLDDLRCKTIAERSPSRWLEVWSVR